MTTAPVRILVVEDHAMVAAALRAAFDDVPDIELVAEATSAEGAVAAAERDRPDVVLLDRRLPDGDGIDAIAQLCAVSPDSRVLVFTGDATDAVVAKVIDAGGAGLLLKAGLLESLLDSIRRAAAGEIVVGPGVWPDVNR